MCMEVHIVNVISPLKSMNPMMKGLKCYLFIKLFRNMIGCVRIEIETND